jgi:predicted nucleic acid-binding protein
MTAVFADTFYWIAVADSTDRAHQRALTLTAARATSRIFTTDEVLTEVLTFFSSAPEQFRSQAAESVEGLLACSSFGLFRRAGSLFAQACDSTGPAPTSCRLLDV